MEASIFFIISSKSSIYFNKELIYLSKRDNIDIIEEDLIKVKEKNISFMEVEGVNESFNIYLYKTKIKIENIDEKIYIKLNFLKRNLKSTVPIEFKKKESIYFIYEISYKCEDFIPIDIKFWDRHIYNIKEFIDDKFRIYKVKKFKIFKRYLEIHEESKYIDNLLECTQNEIINSKKIIDYEFLLTFLITLFDEKEKYSDIPNNLQSIFELTISNFIDIEKIIINNYNNEEYNKIIKILEQKKDDLKDENLLLNLDLIILLFYQTNKKEEFKSFFEKVNYKADVVKYMLKHNSIFKNYYCSELEMIYDNADEEEIGSISLLSSNLNEFINFICLNIEKIKDGNLYEYIDFEHCPLPNEEYSYQNILKFIELIIDKNIYFPSKQFIALAENLNLKDYDKLIQLKSIFIEYEKNFKAKDILKKLNESIHFTGKKFIEENKLDNLKIIDFIQEDAITYYDSYKRDENYSRLIEHIDLDKIDKQFINKFKYYGKHKYDYKKLMERNYNLFINSIIKNVKSFKHLKILYEMFDLDEIANGEIILEIINFLNVKGLNNNVSLEELSNILGKLFVYVQLIGGKKEIINKLIKGLKFNFNIKDINEIFINILNNNNEFKLNKDVIDILIKSINNNTDTLTNEGIITILNNFKNTDIQIHFLQKQKERNITKEELYSIKMSDNLKFFLI